MFNREIETASALMDKGQYDSADYIFRHVIQNMKVLPTNISYYFGKNSYYIKRYKQSINWLNKYIELAGTSGQFFDDAVAVLDKAEKEYREERSRDFADMVKELSKKEQVKCEDSSMVICPVCHGLGVIVKETAWGKEFIACPFSNDDGRMSCEDYKLLLAGELKPKF